MTLYTQCNAISYSQASSLEFNRCNANHQNYKITSPHLYEIFCDYYKFYPNLTSLELTCSSESDKGKIISTDKYITYVHSEEEAKSIIKEISYIPCLHNLINHLQKLAEFILPIHNNKIINDFPSKKEKNIDNFIENYLCLAKNVVVPEVPYRFLKYNLLVLSNDAEIRNIDKNLKKLRENHVDKRLKELHKKHHKTRKGNHMLDDIDVELFNIKYYLKELNKLSKKEVSAESNPLYNLVVEQI